MKRYALAITILLAALCAKPSASAGPPNVILITVDTLRADRLSCYGNKHKITPNIDRLAARGTIFTDAITNVPLTNPSFTTIFTSRYPHETGAIRNGIPMVDGMSTLAEAFQKNGYDTWAVISNWPLKRHLSHLDKGFNRYEDDFHEKRWLIFNDERNAEQVSDIAIEWLEQRKSGPFFAWIHYSDPHAPYEKHSDFAFGSDLSTDSDRYNSEVGFADFHIGRLLDSIKKQGLFKNSIIIFTADHGESLGEHDYTGHGRKVYQPCLHIPFIVVGPGIAKGEKTGAGIQLLDLAPTALSLAGITPPKEMEGYNLAKNIRGGGGYPVRDLYYETYPGAAPQLEGMDQMLTKPIWVGMKNGNVKIMFSVRFQRWEKYNLSSDPAETKDLVDLRNADFMAQSDTVLAWYRGWEDKAVVGEIGVMTDEDRQKFKALGYVDGP